MNESCHIPGSLVIICREIPEFYAVSATQGFSDGLPCARVSAPLCWCWSCSSALLSEVLDCCLVLFAVASECPYETSGVRDSLLIHQGISDWFPVVGSELRFGWRKAGLASRKVFSRTCGLTSGSPTHLRRVLAKLPTCWPIRSALSQGKPGQIENVQHKTSSVNQKLKIFFEPMPG